MSLFYIWAYAKAHLRVALLVVGLKCWFHAWVFSVLIFLFMLYRPQAKRVKEIKNLVSSLSKGDEVLTQG